ncbi:MAG: TlpA disulfide reductase family protein [Hyphomicrobiaceae bacterium]|nr:TlpA disulfide reductase family protein [Hyphomicrobiaceae bacterium]
MKGAPMFDPEKPPELAVERWLNAGEALSLAKLRGRVVVVVAFQMLCPACVAHALPQARRLAGRFNPEQVVVIGLHIGLERHDMTDSAALEAFVSEHRLAFPIAIDTPRDDGPSTTFGTYQMQGTPTLLMFDREGRLRRHYLGQPDDIILAAEIMALAIEDKGAPRGEAARIERKIAATLDANSHDHDGRDHDHHHHNDGEACGCGHAHDHGHHHAHGHRGEHGHAGVGIPRAADADRMTEPPTDIGGRGRR